MRSFSSLLVTGGAGFIGGRFIEIVKGLQDYHGRITILDALTYAGSRERVKSLLASNDGRLAFIEADIRDADVLRSAFDEFKFDGVVNFAAESHVDRSIADPSAFVQSNIVGTQTLLEAARRSWSSRADVLFHQIGTDEVFGPSRPGRPFQEGDPYRPSSPYAASKASADLLVRAYGVTYGLPYTISLGSNTFGPWQHPEKLIPRYINALMNEERLPLYGDGRAVRNWLYVDDHVDAIWKVICRGRVATTYSVCGTASLENHVLLKRLLSIYSAEAGTPLKAFEETVEFVVDRLGHDLRYELECSRIKADTGWGARCALDDSLRTTVRWYLNQCHAA